LPIWNVRQRSTVPLSRRSATYSCSARTALSATDRPASPALIAFGADATPPERGLHLALAARDRHAVDRFHAAAVAAGARDDGPPGIRENYDPGYYAAFVIDHDGHRLEAVVHEPVSRATL
jgi:hypothetical protein